MAGLWIIVLGPSLWEISSLYGLCGACACSAAVAWWCPQDAMGQNSAISSRKSLALVQNIQITVLLFKSNIWKLRNVKIKVVLTA